MQRVGQDMHLRVRPVDQRTIHPDFSLRVHGEADYSSGFEEASSKRTADALSGRLLRAVRTKVDVSVHKSGQAVGCMRREMLDPQSKFKLIRPADRRTGNL